MNTIDTVLIFCTVPNKNIGQDLAVKILTEKLVSCVTIIPNVNSFYYWKNKLEHKHEVQMLLKTSIQNKQAACDYLRSCHPYEIPELFALPIIYCDQKYFLWLNANLC